MNRLNQEIGNIRRTIRNLENPRRQQKGSFNKFMKPAYNMAIEYGYAKIHNNGRHFMF